MPRGKKYPLRSLTNLLIINTLTSIWASKLRFCSLSFADWVRLAIETNVYG